jgi:hypothetical protein
VGKKTRKYQDFVIDKLTNSIENTLSGEVFNTEINQVTDNDIKSFKRKDWNFDWKSEFKDKSKEIFKLTTTNNPTIIQGLLSIEDKDDHIFMHLVESAKFNLGRHKLYLGVPGNLVSYACKVSFDKGYEGFVAFDSKTNLIEHYQNTLGATHLGGRRMYIDTKAAGKLVAQYFKT